MYHAIERGSVDTVRAILAYKPDLEIVAKVELLKILDFTFKDRIKYLKQKKDGDTLLLLAVKKRMLQL